MIVTPAHLERRYVRSQIIRVNSQTRTRGTPSNFTVDFGNSKHLHKAKGVALRNVYIENLTPNVNVANNLLLFRDASGDVDSITIPVGNYNVQEIADALPPLFAAKGITLTVTVVGGDRLQVQASPAVGWIQQSPASDSLGIVEDIAPTTDPVLWGVVALFGVNLIFIHSQALAIGQSDFPGVLTGQTGDIVGNVSLHATPYGSAAYQQYELASNLIEYKATRDLTTIDIRLTPEANIPLEIPENMRFVAEFKVFY